MTSAGHDCPLCGAALGRDAFPYAHEWEGLVYRCRKCTHCSTTAVDPLPDEETLARVYDWERYHTVHYLGPEQAVRHARALTLLGDLSPRPRTILDFGCGDGSFLMAAHAAGFACVGLERQPSTIRATAARTGLRVIGADELTAGDESFDVIHMSDVLGHLPDPAAALIDLERHLAPRGRFVVDGPLERNRSLVFWVARSSKLIRRALGARRVPTAAPTMLMRTDLRAQRRFFTNRLGYRELVLMPYETGWPYLEPSGSLRAPSGVARRCVGQLAVRLADSRFGRRLGMGNRFLGVFEPQRRSGDSAD